MLPFWLFHVQTRTIVGRDAFSRFLKLSSDLLCGVLYSIYFGGEVFLPTLSFVLSKGSSISRPIDDVFASPFSSIISVF